MMDKYYTPTIEEFHIGFECQFKQSNGTWVNHLIQGTSALVATWKAHKTGRNPVRVKYLDKSDIESLGFFEVSEEHKEEMRHSRLSRGVTFRGGYKYGTMNNQVYVKPLHLGGQIDRVLIYMAHLGNGYHLKFQGEIKNKSELKRILKQIGYEG